MTGVRSFTDGGRLHLHLALIRGCRLVRLVADQFMLLGDGLTGLRLG